MIRTFKKFLSKDDGAVTVDWVVLTAAITGLGLTGIGAVQEGVDNLARAVETGVSTAPVSSGD